MTSEKRRGFSTEESKKKKTRWGAATDKVSMPGLPTALPPNLSRDQLDAYVIHVRVEEIGRKLRMGGYMPREKRSVSPEPIYDDQGKRTNTRDARYRDMFEDMKVALVEKGLRSIPGFRPPIDYKRIVKLQEKVYLPVRDFPEINFIGLLIGPRGHTLKKMEADTGVKISIRGKGSVKEGKTRADGSSAPGEDEDLHCLVMAENELNLRAGVKMIDQIIENATSIPEGQNELKRNQLRELAALNGTLREDEAQLCSNCGSIGHRRWECPEASNFTASLICRICSGVGHIARDCIQKNNPDLLLQTKEDEVIEKEYATLMAELGSKNAGVEIMGNVQSSATPWAIGGKAGGAAPWQKSNDVGEVTWAKDMREATPPPPDS